MTLSSKEYIQKQKLQNKAISNLKIQSTCKDVEFYLRVGPFQSDVGLLVYIEQKELIGLHTSTKTISTHMVVDLLGNYLCLL